MSYERRASGGRSSRSSSPARRPRSRAERGEATRAELLRAARDLFARRGFDGTSVRAITRAAGANLGAVTYHFGSKRALYGAVLEQGLRPIAERVAEAARSEGDALERMLRVCAVYFEHLQAHPDLPRLLLQELTAGKRPPAVVLEIVREVKQIIVQLHREGVAEGSVRPGDPLLAALSLLAQPIYLSIVAPLIRSVGPLDLSDPGERRSALEHVLAFARAGLEPAPERSPSAATEGVTS